MEYLENTDFGDLTSINVTDYEAVLVDLDGTLVDTTRVNYMAYEAAVNQYGYHIEYDYFRKECNGKYYLDFLPQLTIDDREMLEAIHQFKKQMYNHYLQEAIVNTGLVDILWAARRLIDDAGKRKCRIGLVTTASRRNTVELLTQCKLADLFDVVITQEDVVKRKPDPEGYIKAMKILGVDAKKTLIFEDSDVGFMAAERAGAKYVKVVFNNE